ncbi:CPBP family intramembrane glutamic endopeptidase [uncultured Methanobrevibacter sp.]|mgnify:CR=1 FL=1|uniref:CPBP family intramembrane glutamic endopeptidase n=1 Tax=uncultured Methanobrevibacter sp. TaxID=253161 RepID=UPI00262A6CA6|nr:type II CAAX endopeptidase family protein [uncultured Methanobrevibacter sp.]
MDFNINNFNERLKTIKLRELIIGCIVAVILITILSAIFPAIYESDELWFDVLTLLILIFFIYALKNTNGLKSNINNVFEKNNKKEIIYVFLINLFFAMIFLALLSGFDIVLGFLDPSWETGFDWVYEPLTPIAFILDAIGTIILAPLVEELVFRGVLLNRLKVRIGVIPAILISSFLFGMGHEFGGMISAFLFGICMCILYLKTDNILIPISVHFLNNLVVTILESSNIDVLLLEFPWIIPTLIISLLSAVLLIIYIYKGVKEVKNLT